MNRVRWLRAEWSTSMRTLAAKMKSQMFTRDSFDGFVIERVRDTFIEARYIEKMNYQETITDPFGIEQVFDRIAYRTVEFSLFSEYPQIELRDAHRSTKEFVSKLLEICNFSVAIVPVSVDLLDWVERFRELTEQKVLVNAVQMSGLELDPGISAKILIKGDKDVREALQAVAAKRKFTLEKVQMQYSYGTKFVSIHLASTGAIKVPADCMNELLPLLRKSLPAGTTNGG